MKATLLAQTPKRTTSAKRYGHLLFLSLLLVLTACNGGIWWQPPADKSRCNPANESAIKGHPLWQDSFGPGGKGAWGCLQLSWGQSAAESRTTVVKIDQAGTMLGKQTNGTSYDATAQVTVPSNARALPRQLKVFVFGKELQDANNTTREAYCSRAMLSPSYNCIEDDGQKCWFAIALAPNATDTNVKSAATGNACQLTTRKSVDAGPTEANPDAPAQRTCTNGQTKTCDTNTPGACAKGTQKCQSNGQWSTCTSQPTTEECNNIDDDCDGTVDQDFPEKDKPCERDGGKGPCKQGRHKCQNGKLVCEALQQPKQEVCNGIDDDCDGEIDENVEGDGTACVVDGKKGPCSSGVQRCKDGRKSCEPTNQPSPEQCDGIDNNCDGVIDEACDCKPGTQNPCYSSGRGCSPKSDGALACIGTCKAGTQVCSPQGKWGPCVGEVGPVIENCNNQDDDCDGEIDGQQRICYSGPQGTARTGTCRSGTQLCQAGIWGACKGEVPPTQEVCDDKDNNCNGMIDEVFPIGNLCLVGLGACQNAGKLVCDTQNPKRTKCNAKPGNPTVEICDGKDNDCNGTIDEGLPNCNCTNGNTRACYTGPSNTKNVGDCKDGTQTCTAGKWGNCTGQVLPSTETCDGKDNNCNGIIDDTFSNPSCTVPNAQGVCREGLEFCRNGKIECRAVNTSKPETCDGKDNDCDGLTDEGLSKTNYYNDTDGDGYGLTSTQKAYCNGQQPAGWVTRSGDCDESSSAINPGAQEICDGKDNNCDQQTDPFCGAKQPYAMVESGGTIKAANGFSANALLQPPNVTELRASLTNVNCKTNIALVSARDSDPSVVNYDCGASNSFRVYGHSYVQSSKSYVGRSVSFDIVIPQTGSWGLVKCSAGPSSSCTIVSPSNNPGTLVSFNAANGVAILSNPLCADRNQPVFASLYGTTPGYIMARASGKVGSSSSCTFQLSTTDGKATLRDFVFWLPERNRYAWANVDNTGKVTGETYTSLPTTQQATYKERWGVKVYTSGAATGYSYHEMKFASWGKPSPVLLTVHPIAPPLAAFGTAFIDPQKQSIVRTWSYQSSAKTPALQQNGFQIMYVRR